LTLNNLGLLPIQQLANLNPFALICKITNDTNLHHLKWQKVTRNVTEKINEFTQAQQAETAAKEKKLAEASQEFREEFVDRKKPRYFVSIRR
jgi:predicted DNA-binding WGR domain protein